MFELDVGLTKEYSRADYLVEFPQRVDGDENTAEYLVVSVVVVQQECHPGLNR